VSELEGRNGAPVNKRSRAKRANKIVAVWPRSLKRVSSTLCRGSTSSPRPSVRYSDPLLDTIARSIHTFFPRCVKCGQPIEAFEDADVRIHAKRVVHRAGCPASGREVAPQAT